MCNSLSIISLSLGHLWSILIASKKVAKWQANDAQTVTHLMWETEPYEIYMYVIDLTLLSANRKIFMLRVALCITCLSM